MSGLIINHQLESITTSSGTLSLNGISGGVLLPSGGTASRPTNISGIIRFNTDSGAIEVANGTFWTSLGTGVATTIVTGAGLAGGTISTSGTISVQANGITNIMLTQRSASSIIGNSTALPANNMDISLGSGLIFSGSVLSTGTSGFATAGTYHQISSLTVNSYGRVTAIVSGRIRLTTNLTLYVSPTGNDSNTGTSVGSPFLTIQKAVDAATKNYDLNGYVATVQLADGTYTDSVMISTPAVGGLTVSFQPSIIITGNGTSSGNVLINPPVGSAFSASGALVNVRVQNLKLIVPGANAAGLAAINGATIIFRNLIFGTFNATSWHIVAENAGRVIATGSYSIEGGAFSHFLARNNSLIYSYTSNVVTLTGTPAFTRFIECSYGAVATIRNSYSGSATGVRYYGSMLGHFDLNGAGINYFPGNAAGLLTTGAQYT